MKHSPNVMFISHGGGPMPLLGDESHQEMVHCLQKMVARIDRPSAIIVVSAHWEEAVPTIIFGEAPSLVYDYYGFPDAAYAIEYPCMGAPQLAQQISHVLEDAGIEANLNGARGFDHGLFVPLKIMYPEADIPCVQLSLVNNLDPDQHLAIGQALQGLDCENLLIIGSGFSFHNMKAFFTADANESKTKNEAFEAWLVETCSDSSIHELERQERLSQWTNAPFARYCHPREEHLLPLHVCYGITQRPCSAFFEVKILNKQSSMYLWTAV